MRPLVGLRTRLGLRPVARPPWPRSVGRQQALQHLKPTSTSRERSSRNLSWPRKCRAGTRLVLGELACDFADFSKSTAGHVIFLVDSTPRGRRGDRVRLPCWTHPQLLLYVFACNWQNFEKNMRSRAHKKNAGPRPIILDLPSPG